MLTTPFLDVLEISLLIFSEESLSYDVINFVKRFAAVLMLYVDVGSVFLPFVS